jgi:hypothetical protein
MIFYYEPNILMFKAALNQPRAQQYHKKWPAAVPAARDGPSLHVWANPAIANFVTAL